MEAGLPELGAGKILVGAGLLLVAAGLLWPLLTGLGLGRLPGDVAVERKGFSFYFPLTTMLLLSLILSGLLWLLDRL